MCGVAVKVRVKIRVLGGGYIRISGLARHIPALRFAQAFQAVLSGKTAGVAGVAGVGSLPLQQVRVVPLLR